MACYYATRPRPRPSQPRNDAQQAANAPVLSEFDKHRETLLEADTEEGWASELRRFLYSVHRDVTKYTNLVEWWQGSHHVQFSLARFNTNY